MNDAPVRLLVCDIDGTLVRHDKSLPDENIVAIRNLIERGVAVTLISARPAAGIMPIADMLGLTGPFGAFNGGTIFANRGEVLIDNVLPLAITRQLLQLSIDECVTRWLFTADRWLSSDHADPHTIREVMSSGLRPEAWEDTENLMKQGHKLVAVCDDDTQMDRIEIAAREIAGEAITLVRSQDYYLDATAIRANKGDGVAQLAGLHGVDLAQVAVIGDQANDIAMFRRAGMAIAMGQARPAVKEAAQFVAASNEQAGVADAIARYILPTLG
ncbi:Cof-type HAD-IIB family hydrolase [Novosphingobium sp.]|uniref:Cof-type HAD-IIB family hydrolase n=1 Tax=Novosphingobium sp. TaxID=1874826 RepID=UPI0025DADFF1|nr:Cof-type HAD-IIB family hydrolase [Novosphingobium sp.]